MLPALKGLTQPQRRQTGGVVTSPSGTEADKPQAGSGQSTAHMLSFGQRPGGQYTPTSSANPHSSPESEALSTPHTRGETDTCSHESGITQICRARIPTQSLQLAYSFLIGTFDPFCFFPRGQRCRQCLASSSQLAQGCWMGFLFPDKETGSEKFSPRSSFAMDP